MIKIKFVAFLNVPGVAKCNFLFEINSFKFNDMGLLKNFCLLAFHIETEKIDSAIFDGLGLYAKCIFMKNLKDICNNWLLAYKARRALRLAKFNPMEIS